MPEPVTAELLADIESLVSVESPSGDVAALRDSASAVARIVRERLGTEPTIVDGPAGPHVSWSGGAAPRVLVVGHHDTVHPLGSLAASPFTVSGGTASGPGIFDMKAGIVLAVHAIAALEDRSAVELLVTCDEETGSATSRDLVVERARSAGSVLVLEPSADGGALKTSRKGTGTFVVSVAGRAAHAGLEPEKGVNAVVALAGLIPQIAALADPGSGTTVTPTLIAGGTADNVVPDSARCSVDVRVTTTSEAARLERAMSLLSVGVPGATVSVTGGIGRPPMPDSASQELFAVAVDVGGAIGQQVRGVAVGGGSDGNLTAAAGVATLDGLGAVGRGAHTRDESIDVEALGPRRELLTALLQRLSSMDRIPPLSSVPAER